MNKHLKCLFTVIAILFMNLPSSCQNHSGSLKNNDSPSEKEGISSSSYEKPDTLTVAVTGDIMLGNTFPHDRLPANDGKNLFDDVRDLLKDADITCGNLEGTIATSGKPRKNPESPMAFMFMMPPRYTRHLTDAG
ncbi:MAG: CapA family protein, partial [Bacteroidales bacterium]|nr:CapA family protein [Bacteroidales bacterium]